MSISVEQLAALIHENSELQRQNIAIIREFDLAVHRFVDQARELMASLPTRADLESHGQIVGEQSVAIRDQLAIMRQVNETFSRNAEELRRQNDRQAEGDEWKTEESGELDD